MTRRAAAVAAAAVPLVLLAACSSEKGSGASSAPATVPDTPSITQSVPPTVSPPPTTAVVTTPPVSSSASSTTAPPSSSPPAPPSSPTSTGPQTTCTKVDVMVLPGGAVPNTQIAGLLFTNAGSSPCVIAGYASVQLLAGGREIGRPARPAGNAVSSIRLRPGQQAESRLTDDVRNCTGTVSDHARVTVPGLGTTVVQPIELRACSLRVDPLGPPD